MYHPTTRLLSILELLQSHGAMSGDQLAKTLEVEKRSLRRYIMMLRDMGIPIEGERGRHGGYSLRPSFRLPPLMFNNDEITAVMLGLMLMREVGALPRHSVESAAAKIARVLPDELSIYAQALQFSLNVDHSLRGAYPVSSEMIFAFSLAVHERRCLQIIYTGSDGDTSTRMIAPYGVVLHAKTWYVPAYCYLREAVRIFRLDRVREVERRDDTFMRPDDFDAPAYVFNALARMANTYVFEVIIHAPLRTVEALVSPATAILEDIGDETLMRCYSDDPHWMAGLLARLELPFAVRETDELRTALRELADQLITGAQNSPNPMNS